jgi:hypothetical protein
MLRSEDPHVGLDLMSKRAQQIGAQIDIGSKIGERTTVKLSLAMPDYGTGPSSSLDLIGMRDRAWTSAWAWGRRRAPNPACPRDSGTSGCRVMQMSFSAAKGLTPDRSVSAGPAGPSKRLRGGGGSMRP